MQLGSSHPIYPHTVLLAPGVLMDGVLTDAGFYLSLRSATDGSELPVSWAGENGVELLVGNARLGLDELVKARLRMRADLAAELLRHGWSYRAIGRALNVEPNQVVRWEQKRARATRMTAQEFVEGWYGAQLQEWQHAKTSHQAQDRVRIPVLEERVKLGAKLSEEALADDDLEPILAGLIAHRWYVPDTRIPRVMEAAARELLKDWRAEIDEGS